MEKGPIIKKVPKSTKKQTHLYLQDRFIRSCPKLSRYDNLIVLYLHNNDITKIENLDGATKLTSLYLQCNKIDKIQNLSNLKCLQKLHLGHNEITVVENLEDLLNLEELYLEKQRLQKSDSLCFDPRTVESISNHLQVLNISHNNIPSIRGLAPMKYLKILYATHNKLKDTEDILETIKYWYYLYEASFVGNPVNKNRHYREDIIGRTIRLEILDNKTISETTRCFIQRLEREKLNHSRQVNLADIYPDLPKNYPTPLQKAVSSSIIKTGLSTMNICKGESKDYCAWKALPKGILKLKASRTQTKKMASRTGDKCLQLQL